uniref:Uncharacterized protein n=1 Tax=Anopheles merus TaxID=30066 RepID=A0A182VER0_ANOME
MWIISCVSTPCTMPSLRAMFWQTTTWFSTGSYPPLTDVSHTSHAMCRRISISLEKQRSHTDPVVHAHAMSSRCYLLKSTTTYADTAASITTTTDAAVSINHRMLLGRLLGRGEMMHLDRPDPTVSRPTVHHRHVGRINASSMGYNSNRDRMVLRWKGSSWDRSLLLEAFRRRLLLRLLLLWMRRRRM